MFRCSLLYSSRLYPGSMFPCADIYCYLDELSRRSWHGYIVCYVAASCRVWKEGVWDGIPSRMRKSWLQVRQTVQLVHGFCVVMSNSRSKNKPLQAHLCRWHGM